MRTKERYNHSIPSIPSIHSIPSIPSIPYYNLNHKPY